MQQRRVAPVAPLEARPQAFLSQCDATSARAQLPCFAEPGPLTAGGATRRLSPLTTLLEAQGDCARTVARSSTLATPTDSLRARCCSSLCRVAQRSCFCAASESWPASRRLGRAMDPRPPRLSRLRSDSPTARRGPSAGSYAARSCWRSSAARRRPESIMARSRRTALFAPTSALARPWRVGHCEPRHGSSRPHKVTRRCCERRRRQGRANAASLASRYASDQARAWWSDLHNSTKATTGHGGRRVQPGSPGLSEAGSHAREGGSVGASQAFCIRPSRFRVRSAMVVALL